MGGYGNTTNGTLRAPYGAIAGPTNLGSGATSAGGGALIVVADAMTVDGLVTADGHNAGVNGAGAGGTVNLTAATLAGSGFIRACGGNRGSAANNGSGGGGRIAVTLTEGGDTGGVALRAHGGGLVHYGAPGTVFLRTPADPPDGGLIVIDNNGYATLTNSYTTLPGDDALPRAQVIVTNTGTRVSLAADAQYETLALHEGVVFNLNSRTVRVRELTVAGVSYRGGSYAAADLGPRVTDEPELAGRIVVSGTAPGAAIMIL